MGWHIVAFKHQAAKQPAWVLGIALERSLADEVWFFETDGKSETCLVGVHTWGKLGTRRRQPRLNADDFEGG